MAIFHHNNILQKPKLLNIYKNIFKLYKFIKMKKKNLKNI
jgi:hypothetical protein